MMSSKITREKERRVIEHPSQQDPEMKEDGVQVMDDRERDGGRERHGRPRKFAFI